MVEENESASKERISQKLCPEIAILYGYSLYLLDHANEAPALLRDARRSVKEFNSLAESFPRGSPERCFCMEVRMAAVDLARGIASRKRMLNEKIRAAEEKKEDMIRRMGQRERFVGVLKAGMRLVLLGGLAYALVGAIIAIPALEDKTLGVDKQLASIATALAVALLGSCIRATVITRRMGEVFREYEGAVDEANEEYVRSVTMQYKLAAEIAEMAWKEMTDEPPPMTSGFKSLLMGVVAGSRAKPPESKPSKQRSLEMPLQKLRVVGARVVELGKKIKERPPVAGEKASSREQEAESKSQTCPNPPDDGRVSEG